MILLRGARQLLTLRGPSGPRRGLELRDLAIIRDGAVLFRDGVILDVGSSRRIENLAAARKAVEWDATGRVVMPGFVDSHTHLSDGPPSSADLAKLLTGETDAVQAAPKTPRDRVRSLAEKLLRHGTTTIDVKCGFGLDRTGALKAFRAIGKVNQGLVDLIPAFLAGRAGDSEVYLDWLCSSMLPLVRQRKLSRFAEILCGEGGFNTGQTRRYLAAARELGFLLKVHLDRATLRAGAELAVEMDAVSVAHLGEAASREITMLANSATIATLLPGSRFDLDGGKEPGRTFIDRGAAVALATGCGAGPSYSMQAVISLACALLRLTPEEAIAASTINGAHALRLAHKIGSIEPGKQADLLVLDCQDYRELPYYFGGNIVQTTVKRGVPVYREGSVTAWRKPS